MFLGSVRSAEDERIPYPRFAKLLGVWTHLGLLAKNDLLRAVEIRTSTWPDGCTACESERPSGVIILSFVEIC
jgi:hypothetical protein